MVEGIEMSIRKYSILGFTILLLVGITVFVHYVREDTKFKETLASFTEIVEHEGMNDLRLTIYYMNPRDFIRAPLTESRIMESYDYKVTVSGEDLAQHKHLLNQLVHTNLQLVIKKSDYPDTRMYYFFEKENGDNIFRVSTSVRGSTMFVNGYEVKDNAAFYEVVMPFLREDSVQELEYYLSNVRK